MKKTLFHGLMILTAMGFVGACSHAPVTGRRQLQLLPSGTINKMGFEAYDEFLSAHKLSDNQEQQQMVKNVGGRIQEAVERYLGENDMSDRIKGYKWDFNLIESPDVNAWAMPGGKVVVYTGIMPVAKDDAGLAVILGHEIAHAVVGHGNERMSQSLIAQMGGMALSEALANKPAETRDLFLKAYGAGTQFGVLLPYSRLHESEADHLGLIFMAMAGYDPHTAIDFWQRMAKQAKGPEQAEFLRTHPTTENRIRQIEELIPEAEQYYARSQNPQAIQQDLVPANNKDTREKEYKNKKEKKHHDDGEDDEDDDNEDDD
jgi:predicted Zn-dependent protease